MRILYILLSCIFFTNIANANPLEGTFQIEGSFFGSSSTLTGDIDVAGNTFSLDPALIYGVPADFVTTEILAPGTYTRTHNTAAGSTITRTATIPSGRLGAYFVILHNGNEYQLFNSWNVTSGGATFTSINFTGNAFIGGTLNGLRGHATFVIPPPPPPPPPPIPGLSITATVDGGLLKECDRHGGGASVTAFSVVNATNGAELDRVEWYLNNEFINIGSTTAFVAPMGVSSLEAIAFAADGVTTGRTGTASIDTRDTTRPTLEIQFLDNTGTVVTSAAIGAYQIHFIVTDICDPSPYVESASATPVMNVVEGDQIVINAADDVMLPTTAVKVSAVARDSTGVGSGRSASAILLIE